MALFGYLLLGVALVAGLQMTAADKAAQSHRTIESRGKLDFGLGRWSDRKYDVQAREKLIKARRAATIMMICGLAAGTLFAVLNAR